MFKNFKQLELLSGNIVGGFPKLFNVFCFEMSKENLFFPVYNSEINREIMEPFTKSIGFNEQNITRGSMKQLKKVNTKLWEVH